MLRRWPRTVWAAILVALTVVVSACGGAGGSAGPTTTADAGVKVARALTVEAPKVGGGTLSLRQFAGQPVALWFWAPT